MEDVAAPSTSTDQINSVDVDGEAKKLLGLGNRHLVMGDIPAAVNAFQEASSLLGKKYGETADECGEAFFLYGKSLLELARIENGVLGNALEGVPEDEDGEKADDSKLQNNEDLNEEERQELREQVYDAMGEAEDQPEDITSELKTESVNNVDKEASNVETKGMVEAVESSEALLDATTKKVKEEDLPEKGEEVAETCQSRLLQDGERTAESTEEMGVPPKPEEHKAISENQDTADGKMTSVTCSSVADKSPCLKEEKDEGTEMNTALVNAKGDIIPGESNEANDVKPEVTASTEEKGGEESEQKEEEEEEAEVSEEDKENEDTEEKENEEDEVGNLQLAWEMLELAKVIYGRKKTKEAQLHAAQAHLKLGEVGVESENYSQAIEDFEACLSLQKQHLEAHDRLLAETHYQLGLAYHYNNQNKEAVLQFTESVGVIEKRMAMLTEQLDNPEGDSAPHKKEMEELKELLPEIQEKIEDAKDAQKSGKVSELALKVTLIPVKSIDGAASSNCVSDISHLVRKKRKPEDESPRKDNEAKKLKQESVVNGGGGGDAVALSGNDGAEKVQEAEDRTQTEPESTA
ncbi:nuclear autoantigenic sperm protein isoform X2 [Microcaecilia unicolor]|uniref:Nuclear autoantigenic sperm protein isoform X2 n=1 Tax=Microcaecilia unicolor TaxID=1415580 RepID=A0A6P7YG54_9AMPH|nr:nuclear autoantigenic sperm protein isoform X2 [Microcaecilia unicolor]